MGTNPRTNPNFGNGEVGGDNSWTAPVHGTTNSGNPVTVTFGKNSREGHFGIAKGHRTGSEFYDKKTGHDHYGPDGRLHADRGAYND